VQFFGQSCGLSVHIEMSERIRPARTVTEAAVTLTAAEKTSNIFTAYFFNDQIIVHKKRCCCNFDVTAPC
jgi:hypothetical protein